MKKGVHPELKDSKIIVNGEQVGETRGAIEEYHVEVWAGNHPFYQGHTGNLVMDEGQVNKFKDKYEGQGLDWMAEGLETLADVGAAQSEEEEPEQAPAPPPAKGKGKGKGKGKKK